MSGYIYVLYMIRSWFSNYYFYSNLYIFCRLCFRKVVKIGFYNVVLFRIRFYFSYFIRMRVFKLRNDISYCLIVEIY